MCRRDVETLQRPNGHTHVEKTLNQRPNTMSKFFENRFLFESLHDIENMTLKRRRLLMNVVLFSGLGAVPLTQKIFDYLM